MQIRTNIKAEEGVIEIDVKVTNSQELEKLASLVKKIYKDTRARIISQQNSIDDIAIDTRHILPTPSGIADAIAQHFPDFNHTIPELMEKVLGRKLSSTKEARLYNAFLKRLTTAHQLLERRHDGKFSHDLEYDNSNGRPKPVRKFKFERTHHVVS